MTQQTNPANPTQKPATAKEGEVATKEEFLALKARVNELANFTGVARIKE